MEKVPEEIMIKIFEQLPIDSLRRVSRVCQRWLFILQNAPTIIKKLKLSIYLTDTNMTIIDELPHGPHENIKISGVNLKNFDKLLTYIDQAHLTKSIRRLKLVKCSLPNYSSYKKIVEKFPDVTHVTFECCSVPVVYDENEKQDVGTERHQNDFTIDESDFDSRDFGDDDFVAMAFYVTHLEIIYSDSYLACIFTISPLISLCHGGFGDSRVLFIMLWSCPTIKELHVFEYSKNFVNFYQKYNEQVKNPQLKNRLEVFTIDHIYDHYLTFELPQMSHRQLKRMEPLAMISFLQSQRESLKELTIMNCPSNSDLVLISSIMKLNKLEMGIQNMQEIQGILNFDRTLSSESKILEMKFHGDVRKMETLRSFVSQYKDLTKVTFVNSDLIYIDPRELSTKADPQIDYIQERKKKVFNTIPTREIGIFKNNVGNFIEDVRIAKIEGKNHRRLKSIKRMEIKNAASLLEVVEF